MKIKIPKIIWNKDAIGYEQFGILQIILFFIYSIVVIDFETIKEIGGRLFRLIKIKIKGGSLEEFLKKEEELERNKI